MTRKGRPQNDSPRPTRPGQSGLFTRSGLALLLSPKSGYVCSLIQRYIDLVAEMRDLGIDRLLRLVAAELIEALGEDDQQRKFEGERDPV